MLIRRNTKAFKTIEQIVAECKDRADREKLIRLYITKAGHSIEERIPIEGIEGGAELFYDMTYQTVLNNLRSAGHQLQLSDDGLYFFHSSSNKTWAETPFEFDEAITEEFASLADLPAVRKKRVAEKFSFPKAKKSATPKPGKREKPAKQEKPHIPTAPPQPDFKLRHTIHFEDLERIIFRQPRLTRRDVLTFYHRMAHHLLPWLKDRPMVMTLRKPDGRRVECTNVKDLTENSIEIPAWLKTGTKGKDKGGAILCHDLEHLLFYVGIGCLQFNIGGSRVKTLDAPDFLVIGIDSPDAEAAKAIEVALITAVILDALHLPSFIKTNGISGLHVCIPLDSKSETASVQQTAEILCKLFQLKIPGKVALEGSGDHEYGKVKLDYLVNDQNAGIIAPYSLTEGESPMVSTPLSRDEMKPDLKFEEFDHENVLRKLKRSGDPLTGFYRKKVNADALLKELDKYYGFLF